MVSPLMRCSNTQGRALDNCVGNEHQFGICPQRRHEWHLQNVIRLPHRKQLFLQWHAVSFCKQRPQRSHTVPTLFCAIIKSKANTSAFKTAFAKFTCAFSWLMDMATTTFCLSTSIAAFTRSGFPPNAAAAFSITYSKSALLTTNAIFAEFATFLTACACEPFPIALSARRTCTTYHE